MSLRLRSLRPATRGCPASSASGGIGAACERLPVKTSDKAFHLTTPDLILLSLLAERPMHGSQANAELDRRNVRDWAGISRPQIYYSIEKLVRCRLLRGTKSEEPTAGPERYIFVTTAKGRRALADALGNESWATQVERPAFLTWLALSWQSRRGVFNDQVRRRRQYLEAQLLRERITLMDVFKEVVAKRGAAGRLAPIRQSQHNPEHHQL